MAVTYNYQYADGTIGTSAYKRGADGNFLYKPDGSLLEEGKWLGPAGGWIQNTGTQTATTPFDFTQTVWQGNGTTSAGYTPPAGGAAFGGSSAPPPVVRKELVSGPSYGTSSFGGGSASSQTGVASLAALAPAPSYSQPSWSSGPVTKDNIGQWARTIDWSDPRRAAQQIQSEISRTGASYDAVGQQWGGLTGEQVRQNLQGATGAVDGKSQLPPDVLANQSFNTPFQGADGKWYIRYGTPITGDGEQRGSVMGYTPQGIARVSGPEPRVGEKTQWFDPTTGQFQSEGSYKEGTSSFLRDFMTWALISVGAAAGAGALGVGTGAGAGTVGGAGGFIGEGALSGIGSWDAALAASPSWTAGAAAVPGVFNAAADSQLANAAIQAGGGDALAGYTAAGAGGVTGSPIGSAAAVGGGTSGAGVGGGAGAGGSGGGGTSSLGGMMSGAKDKIISTLASLGMSGKDAAALAATLLASQGGGGGGGGGGSAGGGGGYGSTYNATGPGGSLNWTIGPDGRLTQNTQLSAANQFNYNGATDQLSRLLGSINPTEKAPSLIQDAGGSYQAALAKTINDRITANLQPEKDRALRALETRLAERGFSVDNEGYRNEMSRFQKEWDTRFQDAAAQAQIQAATQGLNEANFTNSSRMAEYNANQKTRQDLAALLAGVRNNAMSGISGMSGGAPDYLQWLQRQDSQNASRNQTRNDLYAQLLQWGLS